MLSLRNRHLFNYIEILLQNAGRRNQSTFQKFIGQRMHEARKSIIVKASPATHPQKVLKYFAEFGKIQNCFVYRLQNQVPHFLIEYQQVCGSDRFKSKHDRSSSNIFYLFDESKYRLKSNQVDQVEIQRGKANRNIQSVVKQLDATKDLSNHIQYLYDNLSLDELAIRRRFITAVQVQSTINLVYPRAIVMPFGSSVNGFGNMESDLDLNIEMPENEPNCTNDLPVQPISNTALSVRQINTDVLKMLQIMAPSKMPGVLHINPVLNATVPIIKYKNQLTDVEVDVTTGNISGAHMSELLFLFGELDNRVRPLTFFIRRWAERNDIVTKRRPTCQITNFTLTCLVLFFLQFQGQRVLPTLNQIKKKSQPSDSCQLENGENCSFAREINRIDFPKTNYQSLAVLTKNFFAFYSEFDFQTQTISLDIGRYKINTLNLPMHIINPLFEAQNVARNVSKEYARGFNVKTKQALEIIESNTNEVETLEMLLKMTPPQKSAVPVKKIPLRSNRVNFFKNW